MDDQAIVQDAAEEYKDLPIRDYALLKGIPEPTVRSRIRAGKITTVMIEVDGNQQRGIRVPISQLTDHQSPLTDNAQSSGQSSSNNGPQSVNNGPDYQIIITDRDKTIKDLKAIITDNEATIKDRDSTIKELEKRLSLALINLARLTEAARSKDKIIQAKEETILSNKALVLKMQTEENERNPALDAMSEIPGQPQQNAPHATNRPGWMIKVGRFLSGQ